MAAFDFGVKVDPHLFDKQLNASVTIHIQDYIRQGWYKARYGKVRCCG